MRPGRLARALPLVWVALAVPAGDMYLPDSDPPTALWALVFAPVWAAALAAGGGVRRLLGRTGAHAR